MSLWHVTCERTGYVYYTNGGQNPDFSCHQNSQLFGVWSAYSFVGKHNSQGILQQILLMMAVVMMAPLTKGEIRWNLWLAMSWVGGREQVGALRSWQPALQSSITTILRQMHLRSSLLVLSPGDIWDQRGNLGRSGVASSAAPPPSRTRRAGNLSGSPATNNATQPTSSLATNHGIGFSAHFWVRMWFACRIEDHLSWDWGSWILIL